MRGSVLLAALVWAGVAGRPVEAAVLSVPADADTDVEAGADVDHGGATQLQVDAAPVKVAYLSFTLPAAAQVVTQAVLVLSVTNPSLDGGTVYALPGASWVEGTGAGTGLRWSDVDRNGDGRLDGADGSALVPDAAHVLGTVGRARRGKTREIDVTAAFQAGPGVYTLAIAGGSSDAVAFASREYPKAARRPVLRVVTADAPPSPPSPPAPPPPAPGPSAGSCLDQSGPLVSVTGTFADKFARLALLDGSRVDARTATFLASPTNLYPFRLGGGAGVCVSGGAVSGQYDRTLGWQAMHDINNAGVVLDGPDITLENVRVDDVEDGIRPESGPFTVRGAWLTYVRDDCVENDHLQGGLIEDSLFDGCYVGVSERPSPTSTLDGRSQLLTVRGSLVRLEAMPGPRGGLPTDLGHGIFFKWDPMASGLALHDNVFMAERVSQSGGAAMGMPDALTACSNNVMVWLGPGEYPAALPSCFTVTKDRSVWDQAVAAWKARHGVAP